MTRPAPDRAEAKLIEKGLKKEAPPITSRRKAKGAAETALKEAVSGEAPASLASLLSKRPIYVRSSFWLIGEFPLITNAWSHKAKQEMLAKQLKATRAAKEARDPKADFVSSLYEMGEGTGNYGFPITGIKNAILSCAHKDKGIPRSAVMASLFLEAEMIRVMPALAGAVCDLPLVRIWGSKPVMREDMVKIGSGLNKVASLAYRAQFTTWAIRVTAKYNPEIITPEALAFLIQEAGVACGLGEWRNERKGVFGAFRLGTAEEEEQWERFAAGKGPLPVNQQYAEAAE